MAQKPSTFRQFVTVFTDFLTVATHTILYERGIYPESTFLSVRKYEYVVHQSRHPGVCDWVNDAIKAVECELLKCALERVMVVIFDSANRVRERFVFDVSRFPYVPATELDTPLERIDNQGLHTFALSHEDVEEQLRGTMSKISQSGAMLRPLPSGCSFTIAAEIKNNGKAPIGHPQAWIPTNAPEPSAAVAAGDASLKLLRSVAAGSMIFESYVEQSDPL